MKMTLFPGVHRSIRFETKSNKRSCKYMDHRCHITKQQGENMFIDFLTVIMINLVAGSALLAYYLWRGLDDVDQRPYAAAFFGVGLLALVTGLQLSFTWPLPGSYNIGYGDATTLFGIVFLAT